MRTLTAFLLFNKPQIPIQNNNEDTIKNACNGMDSKLMNDK